MKKNIMLIILTIIVIILIGTTIDLYNKLDNKKNETTSIQEKQQVNTNTNIDKDLVSTDTKEEQVIEYIEELDTNVDSIIKKENVSEKEQITLKESFILLTDFIFYDGEIKGVKFSELRNDIKEKVIDLYEKIDSKIESKFPNYKENIKDIGTKTYTNIKEKAVEIKNSIIEEYKNKVTEEGYNTVVDAYEDGKKDMKDVYEEYKPYIDEGKEQGKNILENVKEKLSNWYQEYKAG